jgi:hypothetical protein
MSDNVRPVEEDGRVGTSRRAILAAAATAWTVPAIIAVTGSPAMAATPGPVVVGSGCKHPGASQSPFNQDYHFVLSIENPTAGNITVTINETLLDGAPVGFSLGASNATFTLDPKDITVPPGGGNFIIHLNGTASANTSLVIEYTYDGVEGQTSAVASVGPCDFPGPAPYP